MKYLIPAVLVLIGALALFGCARKPLTPVTPWADVANDSLSFFTVSTDPEGLKVCYIFDWDNDSTTTTEYFQSGETAYCSRKFADTRVRYIRARARNEKGAESGWSPSLRFRLSHPPALADTILGLPRWAADRWYHASVRVTDPDADSVAVRFEWGDLPAAGWSAFVPSGSVVSDSCKWTLTGPHTVRVVLKDKGCTISCPSEAKTVSVSTVAVLWANEDVYSETSPALGLVDGRAVVCLVQEDGVSAINADGTTRWKWQRDPMSEHFGPSTSADGTRLYVADDNRGVICFDVATGAVRWQLAQQYGDCTPVVGPNGTIYVTSGREVTRLRDLGNSAAVDWTVNYGFCPATNLVLGASNVLYAVSYGQPGEYVTRVFALDTAGGLLWQDTTHVSDWGCYMNCPAVDSRGRLIVANGGDSLVCFNPDGTPAWNVGVAGIYGGGITVGYDDRIYVQSTGDDYCIWCLDSDGQVLWNAIPPDYDYACNNLCALSDSSIFFLSYGDYLGCVDWSGRTLWDFWISDSLYCGKRSSPRRCEADGEPTALVGPDRCIYLNALDGLCCLAVESVALAHTAWPTYNHDAARSGWAGRP